MSNSHSKTVAEHFQRDFNAYFKTLQDLHSHFVTRYVSDELQKEQNRAAKFNRPNRPVPEAFRRTVTSEESVVGLGRTKWVHAAFRAHHELDRDNDDVVLFEPSLPQTNSNNVINSKLTWSQIVAQANAEPDLQIEEFEDTSSQTSEEGPEDVLANHKHTFRELPAKKVKPVVTPTYNDLFLEEAGKHLHYRNIIESVGQKSPSKFSNTACIQSAERIRSLGIFLDKLGQLAYNDNMSAAKFEKITEMVQDLKDLKQWLDRKTPGVSFFIAPDVAPLKKIPNTPPNSPTASDEESYTPRSPSQR